MGPFYIIEPPKLERQQDGRRLALEVLREIRDAGKAACSADPADRKRKKGKPKGEKNSPQCGALVAALAKLKREGTLQACAGFAVVLTDLIGAGISRTLVPEEYTHREERGRFLRWKGEAGERQTPSPEGEGVPESTGVCSPRSPDHNRRLVA